MRFRPARLALFLTVLLSMGAGRAAAQRPTVMPPPSMPAPRDPDFSYRQMPRPPSLDALEPAQPRVRVEADYPLEVQALGIKGEVIVRFTVTADGLVRGVSVVKSPHPVLSALASKAIARWIFEPARLAGQPVDSVVKETFKFRLPWHGQAKALAKLPPDGPVQPVYQPIPQYPVAAAVFGVDGEVTVDFRVGVDGQVRDATTVRSTNLLFEAPAVAAVSQWIFLPARVGGKPQESHLQVPVKFHLTPELKSRLALSQEVGASWPFASSAPASAAPPSPPKPDWTPLPVYPFAALLDNRRATVAGEVTFAADGRVAKVEWADPAPTEEFARAVAAMLDARAARSPALHGRQPLRLVFDPYDGDVRVSDTAAAILKRLRLEGAAAVFAAPTALDAPLAPVAQGAAVGPAGGAPAAEVTVEFFIDEQGRAVLPHAVAGGDPAQAAAACQAVAGWRFQPPLQQGRPTTVRTTATLKIDSL